MIKNNDNGRPQKSPNSAGAAPKAISTAARTKPEFPKNGVTSEQLLDHINTLQDVIQPGSRDFSGQTLNTIAQSPKLMGHLKDFVDRGWRIEIKRDADDAMSLKKPSEIVSKSDKKSIFRTMR